VPAGGGGRATFTSMSADERVPEVWTRVPVDVVFVPTRF
jgi:hypothetical protein